MSTINSLPFEVLQNIIFRLPQALPSLITVSKLWHRACFITHLVSIQTEKKWNDFFSTTRSSFELEYIIPHVKELTKYSIHKPLIDLNEPSPQVKILADNGFPFHVRIVNLKEQLPLLKTLWTNRFFLRGVTLTHAPLVKEIDELFTMFQKQIDTVYFTECDTLSPFLDSLPYPTSLKTLFFRNVTFTPELLETTFKKLTVSPALRKVFIQSPSMTPSIRQQLQELERTKKLEIAILEPHPWDIELFKDNNMAPEQLCDKCVELWRNPNTAVYMTTPAEKFKRFLSQPSLFYNPLRKRMTTMLQQEVYKTLKQQVEENPNHVLALNCLAVVLFFLAPSGNLIEAEGYVNKALKIEPDNILSQTLLMCLYDQKAKADTSFCTMTYKLSTQIHCQLMNYASKRILYIWFKIGAKDGYFATTDNGIYWKDRGALYNDIRERKREINTIAQREKLITFNIDYLTDLLMNIMRQRPASEIDYVQWKRICLNRYPHYAPFLKVLAPSKQVFPHNPTHEWEKTFAPEELSELKHIKDSYSEADENGNTCYIS